MTNSKGTISNLLPVDSNLITTQELRLKNNSPFSAIVLWIHAQTEKLISCSNVVLCTLGCQTYGYKDVEIRDEMWPKIYNQTTNLLTSKLS